MAEAFLDLPDDLEDGDQLADWTEAILFLEQRDSIGREELKRRLVEKGGDVEVGLLLERIRTRRRRADSSYPFDHEGDAVTRRNGIDETLYEFLLWVSFPQSPIRRKHDYRAIDRLFDRVVLSALVNYLGPRSTGVRFGTPASDGRPKGFADALVWLGDLMNLETTGSIPPNDDKNDAGADVIVWLPFPDTRSDYLVAIAQCTVRDSWEDKAAELHAAAESWGGGWIGIGRNPVTFLAVPFEYSSRARRFTELRGLVNVIFDRIRLCDLADPGPSDRAEMQAWATEMRDELLAPATVTTGLPKDA